MKNGANIEAYMCNPGDPAVYAPVLNQIALIQPIISDELCESGHLKDHWIFDQNPVLFSLLVGLAVLFALLVASVVLVSLCCPMCCLGATLFLAVKNWAEEPRRINTTTRIDTTRIEPIRVEPRIEPARVEPAIIGSTRTDTTRK